MKTRGIQLLKQMFGKDANFREDQWKSIESALQCKKTLVVQKTGWGKSMVYFIATKLLREQGKGPTILISPLLSLMRNQIESAQKIGIIAQTINSDNTDDWTTVEESLKKGDCDILLLSPERLGNEDFITRILPAIKDGIGMFVVDEAHCISDWGHDFRPDYRRIIRIINSLPPNIPILATTATANERVVNDIKEQFGNNINVIRGPLTRESLRLQTIKLDDQAQRLAWIYENINKLEGSGIIYCLTTSDCNKVASWLRKKGINVLEYHARLSTDSTEQKIIREEREQMLIKNEVKALVATIALGMGFDKPDLGFVIHYQRPGSVVEYYQQIGRAGRALENAYAILLNGKEDDEIKEYFIKRAFPSVEEMQKVVNVIENSSFGIKKDKILEKLNMTQSRLDNCLKLLTIDRVISKENSTYTRTLNKWVPDIARSNRVTEQRYHELEKMSNFVEFNECFMEYIAKELDDYHAKKCGKCSNCLEKKFFSDEIDMSNILEAIEFLRGEYLDIEPKKMWPSGIIAETRKKISVEHQNKIGKVLCSYGDSGWGKYVQEDKYVHNYFREELVDASVNLIKNNWEKDSEPKWVTSVPSIRRPELVKSFAQRVAGKLGIPYIEVIKKSKNTVQQKEMNNSHKQCKNALDGFEIKNICFNEPVILIDDMMDSGWTFTVCGMILKQGGSKDVYPFAIASTAGKEL